MSGTKTLIQAMRILAHDIQSDDGVANAAIADAADRLEELARDLEVTGKQLRQHELLIEENLRLKERINRLEEQIAGLRDPETMRANLLRGLVALPSGYGETGAMEERIKRLELAGDLCLDFSFRGMHVIAEKQWREAKETKP